MGKTNEAVEYHKRLSGSGMGTAGVAGDWVASGGFGSTAAVTFTGSPTDRRGCVTVTCGGTGQGANPTLTWTFKDGAWPDEAPVVFTQRCNATQPTIPFTVTTTTTAAVFTFRGTASGSEAYTFNYQVVG